MPQRTQKIVALLLFFILLVAIPITVKFGAQQQQQTQQKAYTPIDRDHRPNWTNTDNGITITLTAADNPRCFNGGSIPASYTVAGLSSFQGVANLQVSPAKVYNIKYAYGRYFCATQAQLGPPGNNKANQPPTCFGAVPNGPTVETKGPVATDANGNVQLSSTAAVSNQGACGYYQFDLALQVLDTNNNVLATFGNVDNPGIGEQLWSVCASDVFCGASTPTPTNTPTVTPTNSPTPTTVITVTPTNTPTLTPTGTITPTTPVTPPTATPTTPFAPTATPTPKPTLPPTGPSDTVIGVGLAGVAVAIVGTLLFLAL